MILSLWTGNPKMLALLALPWTTSQSDTDIMPTHVPLHEGYEPAPSANPGLPSLQQVWSVCLQSQRGLFISQLKIKLQPAFCKEKNKSWKGREVNQWYERQAQAWQKRRVRSHLPQITVTSWRRSYFIQGTCDSSTFTRWLLFYCKAILAGNILSI